MNDKLTIQATGDFPFQFYIEKAVPGEENGEMIITGIASTVNIDHDNERMAKDALSSMATIINEKSVPLRLEHQKTDSAICGQVFKAWLDERNQLWVKAVLDPANPAAPILYKSLKEGVKLGLSVGGRVKRAMQEFSEKTGRMVKTFYDVVLDEVSVTQRPANYDAWLFAKSIAVQGEDTSRFYGTSFYRQFLFENQQLDYMQAFAKSVPNKAWQKVEMPEDSSINKTTMEDKDKKDEATETETTKYASVKDFESLKSMVAKGFEAFSQVLSKMSKDYSAEQTTDHPDFPKGKQEAKNNEQPSETDSTKNPEQKAQKQREGQETGAETGGQHTAETESHVGDTANKAETDVTEHETKPEVGATANKSQVKKDVHVHVGEDGSTDTKGSDSSDTGTDATGSSESSTEKTDETGTDEKKPYGAEYQMKSAIDRISAVSKAMDDKKTDETETETTKSIRGTTLDLFVATVTDAIEKMSERMAEKGIRVPGFEKHIVDIIQNSPELQEEIKKMMKEPGLKKSVSLGVPYMVTKEGKRFELIAKDTEEVKKSTDEKPKSFKEMYKTEYSSVKE